MKRLMALVFTVIWMTATQSSAARAVPQKYDIKSGIVTMDSVMKMGTMEMKSTVIVYFDDYGMKECKETYIDGNLDEAFFSDGKTLYKVKPNKKTVYTSGVASRGTELRVDFSEMGTEQERASGKIKKIVSMQIAGKSCDAFEMNPGSGTITQYAGWKKIMVYMKTSSSSMTITIKATKIEENVIVPPDKFQIPAGYDVK